MTEADMKLRTKAFALRVIKLVEALPRTLAGRRIADQLLRAAMSVAANYRAACRARSRAEFSAKLGIAEEEADEAAFWIELIIEAGLLPKRRVTALLEEANQLTAILVASRKTSGQARCSPFN